jgi:hypothetical protein
MTNDEKIIQIAKEMRIAYNSFAFPKEPLMTWEKADKRKQEAWIVCARAAVKTMEKLT